VLLGGPCSSGACSPARCCFVEQKDFVWGLIASMYLGNIAGPDRGAHLRATLRRDPCASRSRWIAPIIIVICAIGLLHGA